MNIKSSHIVEAILKVAKVNHFLVGVRIGKFNFDQFSEVEGTLVDLENDGKISKAIAERAFFVLDELGRDFNVKK